MRTRVPSVFFPPAVTVTVVGGTFTGDTGPRPPPPPGIRNVFCSILGSAIRDAMPFRSPVTEWHDAHFDLKYASPAFASPTRTLSGVMRDSSDPRTLKLWM